MKKVLSLLLAVILTVSLLPATYTVASATNVGNEYTMVSVPWNLINKCGHQAVSGPCQAYCWAYCRIILDNKSHTYYDYWTGKMATAPSAAGYTSQSAKMTSKQILLETICNNVDLGRPVVVRVKGVSSKFHYVVAIGYRTGCDRNNLAESDILILNPANKAIKAMAGTKETYTYLSSCILSQAADGCYGCWTTTSAGTTITNDCATHTKGTYLWCEKAHPHYNYFTCAVCGKTFTDGTTEILGSCTQCQQMETPVASPVAVSIQEGIYTLAPQCAPNLRLDVASGSSENKANIQIYQDNGTIAQQFEFASVGDGYYSITAKVSGKCLDVQEGKNASGTNVWQYTPNATDAQIWRLEDAGDGYYYIVPKLNTNLCLDVYGAKNENRTNVQVYNRNQTSAQKWALIPLDTASEAIPVATPSNSGYWGSWSEWSTNYVEESSTRHVESQQVKVSDGHTEYRYGRYIDSTGAYVGWCAKYMTSRYSPNASIQYSDWSTIRYADNGTKWTCGYCGGDHTHALYTSSDGRAFWARHVLPEGNFYWEESRVVDAQYETQYRYQDWIPG